MAGFLIVNAALAVFNMLPIPPLDGSRLLPLGAAARGPPPTPASPSTGFLSSLRSCSYSTVLCHSSVRGSDG